MLKKTLPLLLILAVIFVSCKNEKQKLAKAISNKEKELMADSVKSIDRAKAREMIDLYKLYASKYKEDTLSDEYIFKAADISNGISEHREAIALYKQVAYKAHFRKNAIALFLQGFIFENALQDYFQARLIYEDFLKKYPDHPLTDDVSYSLQNLGKSPEELIKEFENNQLLKDTLASNE